MGKVKENVFKKLKLLYPHLDEFLILQYSKGTINYWKLLPITERNGKFLQVFYNVGLALKLKV